MILLMSSTIERTLIHHGRRFDFELAAQTVADGSTIRREVVRHPGAVVVLAVTADNRIVLIRNFRVAVEDWVWELPAGTMEPPEPAIQCAKRELEEETGYLASSIEPISEFLTTPGMTDELMRAFFARDLTQTTQKLEHDERIEVHLTPVEEALEMIESGDLRDAKSMIAILLALRTGRLNMKPSQ
jgi:ADP-ribose diphosphatase